MPATTTDWWFWLILIVAMVAFLALPQWMARRRQRRREEDLKIGDAVLTIGGLMGEITYLDFEANLARIKLAEGVEIGILPGAISGKRAPTGPVAAEQEEEVSAPEDEG